jgi:general secretion pathway protein K
MDRRGRRPGSERGFALLVVLWWTVLLALLGTELGSVGRLEAERASNLRDAAMAQAAAEGVLEDAVFHLLDGSPKGWIADGTPHAVSVPGGLAHVEVRSEAAKIGLNVASAKTLVALMGRLGTPPARAAALADAILDWRTATPERRPLGAAAPEYQAAGLPYAPPDSDFETIGELALVRGMTPDLVARLAPHLSVFQTGDPDPALADDVVRLASLDAGQVVTGDIDRIGLASAAAPVLTITVSVDMAAGGRAVSHTVVRLAPGPYRRPFQILDSD